jgi:hypothetical protein
MNLLRRLPLSRLLLLCFVAVIAVAGVALAGAGGSRPVPPRRSLTDALHQALAAQPVVGLTAKISFTNNLLAGAGLTQRSRPLFSGGSGRLWIGSGGRARLELQSDSGDTELYFNRGAASYFDPATRTLYRLKLPHPTTADSPDSAAHAHAPPSAADIQSTLQSLMQHAEVSGAQPTDVAGQPAYHVRVTPHDGGLFAGIGLWWDATHGIPLRVAVYAARQSTPVLQLTASQIHYGTVGPGVFAAPKAAKIVDVKLPALPAQTPAAASRYGHRTSAAAGRGRHLQPTSLKALQAALSVPLSAPTSLAGMPRTGSELVHWGDRQAALFTYGRGFGGIAVLEQQADASAAQPSRPNSGAAQGDGRGPSLPTVKINGSPGTELATPLGAFVRFTRAQVSYTLLGSVPAGTALDAARGL